MQPKPDPITTVEEYQGQSVVRVSATQLGSRHSASQARKIVQDWCEFFAAGPTPITSLAFVTRTPKRLFDSLSGQTQLRELAIKWGDYADLSPISNCRELRRLSLRGASQVTDVSPLAELESLESLEIEGFGTIPDPSPLGRLRSLKALELGGNWMTPKNGHLPTIEFLRDLPGLERLLLHTVIVDDRDYAPVLGLPNLASVRIMEVRGMSPTRDELKASLPWDG